MGSWLSCRRRLPLLAAPALQLPFPTRTTTHTQLFSVSRAFSLLAVAGREGRPAKALVDTVPALRTRCNGEYVVCWPAHRPDAQGKRRKERTTLPHPVWSWGVFHSQLAVDCLVGIGPLCGKLFSRRKCKQRASSMLFRFIIYHFLFGRGCYIVHCMHKQSR